MVELRDYQMEIAQKACATLINLGIVYLAMEVRTGKTLTALATAEMFGAKRVLFVTKLKAVPSIQDDYTKSGVTFFMDVTNYERLQKCSDDYDLFIVDEAHTIGAFPKPSQRTKMLKELVGSKPLVLLSGTPTPESYSQIFFQFWVSDNSPFKDICGNGTLAFYKFAKQFCDIKQKKVNGYIVNDYSQAREEEVKAVTDAYMISYTQKEAGFDVSINEHILECKSNSETEYIFKKLKKERCVNDMYTGLQILADKPAVLLTKLNQITGGTVIDATETPRIIDPFKAVAIAEKFKGQRIAIFYVYQSEKKLLLDYFKDEVTTVPEDFQEGKSRVFVGQVRSVREGVRLDKADAIIYYSMEFSYLSYEQGRNRLVSKERQKPADVWFAVSQMGLESKILEAVHDKKDFTLSYYNRHQDLRE
jgi:hypothetical protein